ncbi:hypothetical protein FB645_002638 [Coemansia sp. IMI 203386]|nr:hypothetical protein FB645_002638 [Coemansia sp. IMI 203386]
MSNLSINSTKLDEGLCIRPHGVSDRNTPVWDPSSDQMRCRTTSMDPQDTAICDIQAGKNITVEFHKSGTTGKVISDSHKGPCLVYMSQMEYNGEGPVWFKIYEDGYDTETKQWCVTKLIANDGKLSVNIPEDIKPGPYLLRAELIALHNAKSEYKAGSSGSGAQYYLNCAQVQVYGSGSVTPDGVSIPGVYKADDPGLVFNIYNKTIDSYPIPGPTVYVAGSQ